MKRMLALALAALLLLTGCGGKKTDTPAKQEETTTYTGIALGDVTVRLGEALTAEQREKLGSPMETQQFPSCISGATDTKYVYSEFALQVYPQEDAEILQIVELLSDTYATEKGVKVGDTAEAVKQAYGDAIDESKFYIDYALTETITLSFELKDGIVKKIVYTAAVE